MGTAMAVPIPVPGRSSNESAVIPAARSEISRRSVNRATSSLPTRQQPRVRFPTLCGEMGRWAYSICRWFAVQSGEGHRPGRSAEPGRQATLVGAKPQSGWLGPWLRPGRCLCFSYLWITGRSIVPTAHYSECADQVGPRTHETATDGAQDGDSGRLVSRSSTNLGGKLEDLGGANGCGELRWVDVAGRRSRFADRCDDHGGRPRPCHRDRSPGTRLVEAGRLQGRAARRR